MIINIPILSTKKKCYSFAAAEDAHGKFGAPMHKHRFPVVGGLLNFVRAYCAANLLSSIMLARLLQISTVRRKGLSAFDSFVRMRKGCSMSPGLCHHKAYMNKAQRECANVLTFNRLTGSDFQIRAINWKQDHKARIITRVFASRSTFHLPSIFSRSGKTRG